MFNPSKDCIFSLIHNLKKIGGSIEIHPHKLTIRNQNKSIIFSKSESCTTSILADGAGMVGVVGFS